MYPWGLARRPFQLLATARRNGPSHVRILHVGICFKPPEWLGYWCVLDALPQVEVEGARDLQGVQAEVTADVAEGTERHAVRTGWVSRIPTHEVSGAARAE